MNACEKLNVEKYSNMATFTGAHLVLSFVCSQAVLLTPKHDIGAQSIIQPTVNSSETFDNMLC